jgi:methyl-accepting chemotaxis protein
MDQVVQANASQTEELSATAESLAGQAAQLQALVGRFRLAGAAAGHGGAPASAAVPAGAAGAIARRAGERPGAGPIAAASGGRRASDAGRPARQSRATDVAVPALAPAGNGNGRGGHHDEGFEEF